MNKPNYSIIKWESNDPAIRIIICEDIEQIVDMCSANLGGNCTELGNRGEAYQAFIEPETTTMLVLDGTLSEQAGIVKRDVPYSAEEWCKLKPECSAKQMRERVVVWSGSSSQKHSFFRWYQKTNRPGDDLKQIKSLLVRTVRGEIRFKDWPGKLGGHVEQLSASIHALQNVLLPVANDAKTLNDLAAQFVKTPSVLIEQFDIIKDTWTDHFGAGAKS